MRRLELAGRRLSTLGNKPAEADIDGRRHPAFVFNASLEALMRLGDLLDRDYPPEHHGGK
jgi:hypothetical protein